MTFLPFTYDRPGKDSLKLSHPDTAPDELCAIKWHPGIGCTAEQIATGRSLDGPCDIPWNEITIGEIQVESRKVYEVLHRVTPAGQRFFVRILPPRPRTIEVRITKRRDITIFTHDKEREYELALAIMSQLPVAAIGTMTTRQAPIQLLQETRIAVFCHTVDTSVAHLRHAIELRCLIVASDAGSAEEYLTRFARPGTWHVAHGWRADEWCDMIRDLKREKNDLIQTSYVDQTPYIEAWKDED